MSTILKVIERVDQAKPNAFSTAAKVAWLAALDGRIAVDVFLLDVAELGQFAYRYPEDGERELLVSFPHDDIYDLWLAARIDFENGEYDKYQNTMAMYNEHYASFVQWFTRTYEPARGGGFHRCGNMPSYYLTAYALAVKQGFEGDEAAWLASLQGREVEFRCQKYMLQWRRAASGTQEREDAWKDLVDVASLLVDHDAIADLVREDLQKKIAPKAGFIYPLASGAVPEGFLLCDGGEYLRSEYPELFAAIGTIYGEGDGLTTFNVPDLATRVPVGAGEGYKLGDADGESEHRLTVDEMPAHTHSIWTKYQSNDSGADSAIRGVADYDKTNWWSYDYNQSTEPTGGNQPHNNMQPYTVVNYIIATGKDTAVSVADIVLGAQAIPLEIQYGGTGAASIVQARENLGLKKYLLWQNASINSDQPEQAIDLGDISQYAEFIIHADSGLAHIKTGDWHTLVLTNMWDGGWHLISRKVSVGTIDGSGRLTIGDCYLVYDGATPPHLSNNRLKVHAVYGIKGVDE